MRSANRTLLNASAQSGRFPDVKLWGDCEKKPAEPAGSRRSPTGFVTKSMAFSFLRMSTRQYNPPMPGSQSVSWKYAGIPVIGPPILFRSAGKAVKDGLHSRAFFQRPQPRRFPTKAESGTPAKNGQIRHIPGYYIPFRIFQTGRTMGIRRNL